MSVIYCGSFNMNEEVLYFGINIDLRNPLAEIKRYEEYENQQARTWEMDFAIHLNDVAKTFRQTFHVTL